MLLDHTPIDTTSPYEVPRTQLLIWSHIALAAEAAEDFYLTEIISAPLCYTFLMKPSVQESVTYSETFKVDPSFNASHNYKSGN